MSTIGAGRNLQEARREVVVTENGVRVAFLGYVSVLLPHYLATEDRADAAALRAYTWNEATSFQTENASGRLASASRPNHISPWESLLLPFAAPARRGGPRL